MEDFYALNVKAIWKHFKTEHFSFWMICCYLFFEYVRPQSIFRWLDFLPWAQVFILGALIGWLADSSRRWVADPVNKWMVCFFIVILISSWGAYQPHTSYAKLADFYTWLIIYFLIINIVNTPKRFFIFLSIFLLASFKLSASLARIWAFRGFSFTSWGLSGPPGFFQNSGELAIQMAIFWPLAFAVAISLKPHLSLWKYRIVLAMPITACMVILGSSSRGGQLALAGQLMAKNYKSLFNIKRLIVIAIVVSLGWLILPQEQKDRFLEMGEDKTSQQRLLYWENGIDMAMDHPLFGVGYFNFIPYFERYYSEDMLYPTAELPHNIFIQVVTDVGFVGLAVYLGLIIGGMAGARKIIAQAANNNKYLLYRNIGIAMNVSFIGFIIAGQFVSVVYYPFMWIHLACVVSARNSFFGHLSRVDLVR